MILTINIDLGKKLQGILKNTQIKILIAIYVYKCSCCIFRGSQEKCDTNTESLPDSNMWKLPQRIEITLSTILASVQEQEAQIRVRLLCIKDL